MAVKSLRLLVLILAAAAAGNDVTTDGCGQTKGCMHYPDGCQSPNCVAIISWTTTEPDYVDFEMMTENYTWVAVGFSHDDIMVGSQTDLQCLI